MFFNPFTNARFVLSDDDEGIRPLQSLLQGFAQRARRKDFGVSETVTPVENGKGQIFV